MTVLLLPFQFGCPLFLLLVWLLWLGLLLLCWIRVVKVVTLVLFLKLREKDFRFCPWSMMLAVGFSYLTFILLRNAPSIPTLLSVFIIYGYWILSNVFSTSFDVIVWLLSFILLMWCITSINLWMLNHLYIPGINLEQIFQKLIWNHKRPQIASTVLRKEEQSRRHHNTWYQTILKATGIKKVCY